MKFTKNTNAFRGTFNEVKVLDYLIRFSGAEPISEVIPENYSEILASMSPVAMECESTRAYSMAEMIYKHVREKLNWRIIESVCWTGIPKQFENPNIDEYCSNGHPADILLIAPNDNYLGVSLKNYTQPKNINHKATSFSNFERVFTSRDPSKDLMNDSKENCMLIFESILEAYKPEEIIDLCTHSDLRDYIEVIAYDDYHRTKFKLKPQIKKPRDIKFHKEDNKISFSLVDNHDIIRKGFIMFKKTHKLSDGTHKFNLLTFLEI